jgi:hypothetical protein
MKQIHFHLLQSPEEVARELIMMISALMEAHQKALKNGIV